MYRFTLLLVVASFCLAQGPRIFIVTDMEGVGGVNNSDEQLLPGQRRYDESRHLLAGEVNATIDGALEAGASQVVIWDGHDSSRSLSVDDEKLYDGIMFVGQHAMAGTKGVLSHTQSFSVQNIFLNGQPVGEIGQVAAIAGQFDIPVIMLSGDQAACDEILTLQPRAETVAVKRLVGKASSLSLSHAEARLQIQAAANRAVKRISEFKPWKLQTPVEMKIEYYPGAAGVPAAAFNRGESKQVAPRTVVYRGRTVLEVYQHWLAP